MQQEESMNEARSKATIAAFALKAAKVVAHFDGSGDSGQIQEITANDAEGKPIELDPAATKLFENLLYLALEKMPYDWINNDGGFGEMEWRVSPRPETDTDEGEVEFTYSVNIRITETENYEGAV